MIKKDVFKMWFEVVDVNNKKYKTKKTLVNEEKLAEVLEWDVFSRTAISLTCGNESIKLNTNHIVSFKVRIRHPLF